MNIESYLADTYGCNIAVRQRWQNEIANWRSWYRGYNADFHDYTTTKRKSKIKLRHKSMQIAKKACEDWADVLFNLNCKINVGDKNDTNNIDQKELTRILNKTSFWLLVNQSVEKAFAVGTGALVLSVTGFKYSPDKGTVIIDENTEPYIEFVNAEKIYPISWDNTKCTECAFVTYKNMRGKKYALISAHTIQSNGNYLIENRIFLANSGGGLTEIDEKEENELLGAFRSFDTKSNKRWFCLITPAVADNMTSPDSPEYDYPFGISIFANAIDCIKAIDEAFDSLSNEINTGRKRIFVSGNLCQDIDGSPTFDATDFSVYELPSGLNSEDLIQPENSELRVDEIVTALRSNLSAFSNNVGMGRQMYDFSEANMSTAAQVYSTNSELKRKRDKHKTKLENELYDLLEALCYAATAFGHYNINPEGLSIRFDDSLFEDKAAESQRKINEINNAVAARYEYRTDIYDEDETTAKQKIAEIDEENRKSMIVEENE